MRESDSRAAVGELEAHLNSVRAKAVDEADRDLSATTAALTDKRLRLAHRTGSVKDVFLNLS